ncbi:MAG: RNase adapter protein RapZ [Acidimicrobiaceae bacterium]|nr:RNase adapter protein RapZ [Acidimicrobiaceae bacterium]
MTPVSEFLIITGMSGAGRSTAADTFEDGGWFVIDNMPPALIGKVADLVTRPASDMERVALVAGRGGPDYVDDLTTEIAALRVAGHDVRILFLDAPDDVLVRRFEGTRRRHPLVAESVAQGIKRERELLEPIKSQADVVVDTGDLNVHQLRGRLIDLFERNDPNVGMQTTVVSFGYKYGIPLDVDLVFDCRFLPNPHWIDELRPLTGLDEPVREYVLAQPDTQEFLAKLDDLLGLLLPAYLKEGKAYLTVAVGCTGGRHRSVVLAEEVAHVVTGHGFKPTLLHRDVQR